MSSHKAFRLSKAQARTEVKEIASVVSNWRQYFQVLDVNDQDIERLSASIDRPFLLEPRRWAVGEV